MSDDEKQRYAIRHYGEAIRIMNLSNLIERLRGDMPFMTDAREAADLIEALAKRVTMLDGNVIALACGGTIHEEAKRAISRDNAQAAEIERLIANIEAQSAKIGRLNLALEKIVKASQVGSRVEMIAEDALKGDMQ